MLMRTVVDAIKVLGFAVDAIQDICDDVLLGTRCVEVPADICVEGTRCNEDPFAVMFMFLSNVMLVGYLNC